jgi:sterol desaturase/sphingolipid hydroxylase (fatty acid hydroxylase superfamily)
MGLSPAEEDLAALVTQGRYVATALALALLWTAESLAPMYLGRRRRLSHGVANLALAALNAAVAHGFAFAILEITERSRVYRVGVLHWLDLPVWLHAVLAIIAFDCWQYWWHRLNHRVPFLWRFHAVHHADAELDVTSGVRFHTIEIALSFVVRLVVAPLIGVTVPELLIYEALSLPIILFHHSNLRLPGRADRGLRWLIVTPWMHYVHHSRWQPETDSNYASFLSLWDRLFGSFRLRERPQEIRLGLERWEEGEWRPLRGMLLAPFRRLPTRERGEAPATPGGAGGAGGAGGEPFTPAT